MSNRLVYVCDLCGASADGKTKVTLKVNDEDPIVLDVCEDCAQHSLRKETPRFWGAWITKYWGTGKCPTFLTTKPK